MTRISLQAIHEHDDDDSNLDFFSRLSVDVRVIGTEKMRCDVVTYGTVERAHNSMHRAQVPTVVGREIVGQLIFNKGAYGGHCVPSWVDSRTKRRCVAGEIAGTRKYLYWTMALHQSHGICLTFRAFLANALRTWHNKNILKYRYNHHYLCTHGAVQTRQTI